VLIPMFYIKFDFDPCSLICDGYYMKENVDQQSETDLILTRTQCCEVCEGW
jgi:hypothetical protein